MLSIFLLSCEKEECVSEIQDDVANRTFYDYYSCSDWENVNYRIYYNISEYETDSSCQTLFPIPIDLGFEGIIISIGVPLNYAGCGSSSCYEKSVIISENKCDKILNAKFLLQTTDTTDIFYHNEDVLIFLNGYDDSYEVNLSHEIIPLGG